MPTFTAPTPYRQDIKKTPGRVVWQSSAANPVSIFSKLGTSIERALTHEIFPVGTDVSGEVDQRTKEFYGTVRMTPDGRFTDATTGDIANLLWPYYNYVPGTPIFPSTGTPATNYPLYIHGNDASLEKFVSAALVTMPPLKFSATEVAIGQAEWLCLRGDGMNWASANSLVDQTGDGTGSIADTNFNPANILTGTYYGSWAASDGVTTPLSISPFDTIDGFTCEFTVQWSDDTRQSTGLTNRRIKTVNARVRCSPVGATRQSILAAQYGQGAGAVRGKSIQQNSGDFHIVDPNGNPYFTLKAAALTDDKQMWGSDAVRETDLVWVATRVFSGGVANPLFLVYPNAT